MAKSQTTFIVVFQFGKVASTSIVNAINSAEGVEAVQCHFLGAEVYAELIRNVLRPGNSDYTFEHQLGQLNANLKVSRRIVQIRSKILSERLGFLTVVRDPMDWFGSALVQDIEEHKKGLLGISAQMGLSDRSERERVFEGMREFLRFAVYEFGELGGVEPVLRARRVLRGDIWDVAKTRQILELMLRPFGWFQKHYHPATNTTLSDFSRCDEIWTTTRQSVEHVIVRYERLADDLPKAYKQLSLKNIPRLPTLNVSRGKDFAEEINTALDSDDGKVLREMFGETEYSRFFGYDRR